MNRFYLLQLMRENYINNTEKRFTTIHRFTIKLDLCTESFFQSPIGNAWNKAPSQKTYRNRLNSLPIRELTVNASISYTEIYSAGTTKSPRGLDMVPPSRLPCDPLRYVHLLFQYLGGRLALSEVLR